MLPDFVRRGGRSGRLGFVLEHLFIETADAAPPADETLEVVEAPTPLGEIEEVGRAIRRAMESPQSIAPDRIAVVARDLAPYAEHLRTVFHRYGIPLAIGHPPALRASAPARLIVEILRAPRERFTARVDRCVVPLAASDRIDARLARTLDQIGYVDGSAQPLMDRFERHVEDFCAARSRRPARTAPNAATTERRLIAIERAGARFERMMAALEPLAQSGTLAEHLEPSRTCAGRARLRSRGRK